MLLERSPAGIAAPQYLDVCAATQAFTYDGDRLKTYRMRLAASLIPAAVRAVTPFARGRIERPAGTGGQRTLREWRPAWFFSPDVRFNRRTAAR